jgi:hypothetical protein
MEHRWIQTDRGKLKYFEKALLSATLSTTNPTQTSFKLGLSWSEMPLFLKITPKYDKFS